MSHEIERNDSTIFVGQPAWHGLGRVLPESPSVDEALRMTMDWEPEPVPLIRADTNEVIDSTALVRSDDRTLLSVVTQRYNVIKNATVAKAVGIAFPSGKVETAGSLRGGKQVWFLVRTPDQDFDVPNRNDDKVQGYGLITSSHDGTIPLTGLPTGVRVVCANTMSMALARAKKPISVRHKGIDIASEDAVLAMVYRQAEVIASGMARLKEGTEFLARTQMDSKWAKEYIANVVLNFFGKPVDSPVKWKSDEEQAEAKALASKLYSYLDHPKVKTTNGVTTRWEAYNAVTQWSVHERRTRGSRGESNWLGSGAEMSKFAFDLAVDWDAPAVATI